MSSPRASTTVARSALCFVVLILLAAAFKNDASIMVGVRFERLLPPALLTVKKYSPLFMLMAVAIGGILLLRRRSLSLRVGKVALVLLVLMFLSAMRSMLYEGEGSSKLFMAFALNAVVIVLCGLFQAELGVQKFKEIFLRGFFWFSTIFIAVNLLLLATGYGNVAGVVRFYGTTTHPNFIGLQLAICTLAVAMPVFSGIAQNSRWGYVFRIILFAAGLYLLVTTGSRTAAGVFAVGLAMLAWTARLTLLRVAMLACLLVVVPIALTSSSSFDAASDSELMLVYDRGEGGANTRARAWSSMSDAILEKPLFGQGYFEGYSENSYLRAAAAFGIPFGLVFFLANLQMMAAWFFRALKQGHDRHSVDHVLCSLSVGLFAGGMLEGYLVDSWSLPKLVLLFLAAMSVRVVSPRRQESRVAMANG